MQKDLKRLVAYSSVAHLGFIVLGTFALTTPGACRARCCRWSTTASRTRRSFLLVGMIYERRHTREIAALTGLQKAAPILAAVFTVVMLSSIGLPGLNGFVGEFLILLGSFLTAPVVDGRRRRRRDPRRAVPAVGLPAGVPRRARERERRDARPQAHRGPRAGAAARRSSSSSASTRSRCSSASSRPSTRSSTTSRPTGPTTSSPVARPSGPEVVAEAEPRPSDGGAAR